LKFFRYQNFKKSSKNESKKTMVFTGRKPRNNRKNSAFRGISQAKPAKTGFFREKISEK
jgi:hypothetical protein